MLHMRPSTGQPMMRTTSIFYSRYKTNPSHSLQRFKFHILKKKVQIYPLAWSHQNQNYEEPPESSFPYYTSSPNPKQQETVSSRKAARKTGLSSTAMFQTYCLTHMCEQNVFTALHLNRCLGTLNGVLIFLEKYVYTSRNSKTETNVLHRLKKYCNKNNNNKKQTKQWQLQSHVLQLRREPRQIPFQLYMS